MPIATAAGNETPRVRLEYLAIHRETVMPLDREEVEHIALLARIGLSPEEVELFRGQLSDILDQFQVLSELDTQGVTATGHAAGLQMVLRDDEAGDSLETEDVLRNAPRREGERFRVKAVLEE